MPITWITDATCLLLELDDWAVSTRTIEIRNGKIAGLHLGRPRPAAGERVIDGRRRIALPGLVNAHTHSPDNLLKGSVPQVPLALWSLSSAAGRERRRPRDCYVSAALGAIEMLRSGTSTVLDHVRISPDIDGDCLEAVAQAYSDVGIRAVVAPIVADRVVADTLPLTAADLAGVDISAYGRRAQMPAADQIAVAEAFIKDWHGREGRIYGAIGPSAPQRCSDNLLELSADLAARREIILHMHLLETRVQRAMGRQLYGGSTLAHLIEQGFVGNRTSFAHAIWMEESDLDRLAATGASVIHNPVSNARLGSGICPLRDYLQRGIRVGLGTDSACCNDSNNLLETPKWASLLYSLTQAPGNWVDAGTALRLATQNGASAIGLASITSITRNLAIGLAADITLFALDAPAFVPLHDPVRQIVLCENGQAVTDVLINGELVVANGRCTKINEGEVWSEAAEIVRRLRFETAQVYEDADRIAAPIEAMYRRLAIEEGRAW